MTPPWRLAAATVVVSVLAACASPSAPAPATSAAADRVSPSAGARAVPDGADNFYKSDAVTVRKVTFKNQYRMSVAGNLFTPRDMNPDAKHAAIVVGHPMGAVKEQSANLYATKLAERGFVTLSLDLSFWGESEGEPRNAVAPDIYAEDFSAAVDFLRTQPFVAKDRIGAIGICGSGSFVISAAKIDPRIRAVATVSMYDMGAAFRHALHKSLTLEQRKAILEESAAQRDVEFAGGAAKYVSGTVHELTERSTPVEREFFDFYRTPRGEFTPAGSSPLFTTHPTLTSGVKFMNFYPFEDIETIAPRPLLFITGETAHSREFSEDAYRRAAEPKELFVVPGAGHVDLYDRVTMIPFDKLTAFFTDNLAPTNRVGTTERGSPMQIKRIGAQASIKGPEQYFTGSVRIDPLFDPADPSRVAAASVTFEPGARSAWHVHPLGQRLLVTAGVGLVQCQGGPAQWIHPGDVVTCPPGEKHWHGASPTAAMTHVAIQEALDGKMVEWMEKVTDAEYDAASKAK